MMCDSTAEVFMLCKSIQFNNLKLLSGLKFTATAFSCCISEYPIEQNRFNSKQVI